MSGGVRCHSRGEATALTQQVLAELDIGMGAAQLRRLWQLPPRAFSKALEQVWNRNSGHPFPPIRPVAGAAPLPPDPAAAIQGGIATRVPIIVGSTLDEFKLVVTMDLGAATLDESGLVARFVASRRCCEASTGSMT